MLLLTMLVAFTYCNAQAGGHFFQMERRVNALIKKHWVFYLFKIGTREVHYAAFTIFALLIPFALTSALTFVEAALVALSLVAFRLFGWGSYFDVGQNPTGYKDEVEVKFIDYILLKIYGPDWAPKNSSYPASRFDVIWADTIRPFEWRRKRDATGLALHNLVFAGFVTLPLAIFSGTYLPLLMWPLYALVAAPYIVINGYLGGVNFKRRDLWCDLPTGFIFGLLNYATLSLA